MSKLLSKIAVFLIPVVLYCTCNVIINYFIYSDQSVELEGAQTLILGDSHTQTSVNPELLKNARNISQSAEPYVLTFWKLRKILQTNSPDTVMVGFAPHNIAEYNDLKFSKELWSYKMFERCYPIADIGSINQNIPVDYFAYYKTIWQQTAFYPKTDHIHYIGKFLEKKSNNLSDWKAAIQRHYFWRGKELGISETSVEHLKRIVEMCQKRNIEVVLISSPVHENYFKNIPPGIIERHRDLKGFFGDGVMIFDQTMDATYPDSLFLNSDHMNHYGAERFTNELIDYLTE